MNKTGLIAGILLSGVALNSQAEEVQQFDYLGLPIESNAPAEPVEVVGDSRDYLDLPVAVESKSSDIAAIVVNNTNLKSENNDCLDLPVEKSPSQASIDSAKYLPRN